MRNFANAVKKVQTHKGKLSKALVCYTAKQTLNQYQRRWLTVPPPPGGNGR